MLIDFNFHKCIELFPEIKILEMVNQNPKYHGEGNVFIHTKNVCDAIKSMKEWETLSYQDKQVLYLAGLFHDIGKKVCTKKEDGEIVSPKHAVKGAKIFRELAYKKYNMNFILREKVAALIKYHGLPVFFLDRENIELEVLKASETVNMKLLYLLSKADALGRECNDKEVILENIQCFKEYSKELNCYQSKKQFANSYTRFLYFNDGNAKVTDFVYDNREFNVFIMMGLPLSGKDTYINKYFNNIPIISLDSIREEFKISPKRSSKKVVTIAKERAKVYLRRKEAFIWNGTNLKRENRRDLCDLFSNYGGKVIFIYLEVPYKEILERHNRRERVVPFKVIDKMIGSMDIIEPWEGNQQFTIVN